MCGIAGFQGAFDPALLGVMGDAIAHRGPDDAGQWFDGRTGTGLAHRRLAILDPSPLGHQPMRAASGPAVITFNGEIYNYRELRADLEHAGHRFTGHSDTEVLLALYREHGEAMLPMLNGIFALAVADGESLFIAGD